MKINILNPLLDRRWDDFATRHPRGTVFHQRAWIEALVRTYGYEPAVLTTAQAGEPLRNGILLCRVSSWMTGTRLVSLPFADHCELLLEDYEEFLEFSNWLREECRRKEWSYVETRSLSGGEGTGSAFEPERSYWFHELDLEPGTDEIFRRMHHNSFRRKIRRAEREKVGYEVGRSPQLLDEFYQLLLMTRRRHQFLPQPRSWFENLIDGFGDNLQLSLARKNGQPIAAMMTLWHPSQIVYKYGCSDERFHNLGGMPFLFWKLIEEGKQRGIGKIDLGRCDLENNGLCLFKDRLGAQKRRLTYHRYTNRERGIAFTPSNSHRFRELSSFLPDLVLTTAGRLLYRHLG